MNLCFYLLYFFLVDIFLEGHIVYCCWYSQEAAIWCVQGFHGNGVAACSSLISYIVLTPKVPLNFMYKPLTYYFFYYYSYQGLHSSQLCVYPHIAVAFAYYLHILGELCNHGFGCLLHVSNMSVQIWMEPIGHIEIMQFCSQGKQYLSLKY
jgi:hypothetical protein